MVLCPTIQEESASLVVGSNALQQSKRVADPVRGSSGELRRVEQGVDGDDLLEERCHNT